MIVCIFTLCASVFFATLAALIHAIALLARLASGWQDRRVAAEFERVRVPVAVVTHATLEQRYEAMREKAREWN